MLGAPARGRPGGAGDARRGPHRMPRARRPTIVSVTTAPATPPSWPGKRLGLPESGPRSIARLGRRLGAIAIDWGIAVVLSVVFFQYNPVAMQLIFLGMQILLTVGINASAGHLVLGMRLQRIEGGRLGVVKPIIRAVLLTLLIPAMIWDQDQRGLHDRAVGTILLRR